jgi:c-di-GMP-binding flagellar brake protein YcgR
MDLRIGQTVQLITHGPQPRKYYTPLIGFVERSFFMVRVPLENGWAVQLTEGELLDVRVFSGVFLYEFKCQVQAMLLNPRNYLLLTPPASIRQTRFRSHERAKCALPVQVLQAQPGASHLKGFQFQDLSGSGAALVGPSSLGEPGQRVCIQLDFHLQVTNSEESLELEADVQTVQPIPNPTGQTTNYHHGIRFLEIDPRILLLVNELQKPTRS